MQPRIALLTSNRILLSCSIAVLTALPILPHLDGHRLVWTSEVLAQGRGNDEDRGGGRGNDEDRGRGNEDRGNDRGGNDRGGGNDNNRGQGNGGGNAAANPAGPPLDAAGRARFEAAQERVKTVARGRDLTNDDLDALIAGGWGNRTLNDGFRNHGDRVRTYVAIAKALGEGAYVGALQANFGTAVPKPGEGPADTAWQKVNLDVNKDGVIDGKDLLAAEARPAIPAAPAPTTPPRTP